MTKNLHISLNIKSVVHIYVNGSTCDQVKKSRQKLID